MPELPEVECVRRSVEARIVGTRIARVTLHRRDAVCRQGEPKGGWSRLGNTPRPKRFTRVPKAELGEGARIVGVHRRGKQLAIELEPHGAILVHLGMTGQLTARAPGERLPKTDHVHVTWTLRHADNATAGRLVFRDPRRFGGVWLYPTLEALTRDRWDALGPDALTVSTPALRDALSRPDRPIKAALLDQSVIAGVGNIYADESLFESGIHPARSTRALSGRDVDNLRTALVRILEDAIDRGGSTLRDYANADGDAGTAQHTHKVYGRASEPCVTCGTQLAHAVFAQRSTVWCPVCQPGAANS